MEDDMSLQEDEGFIDDIMQVPAKSEDQLTFEDGEEEVTER